MIHRLLGIGCLVALIGAGAFAQPGNIEGTELEIESILIDAGREKLLGNYQEAIGLYKEPNIQSRSR